MVNDNGIFKLLRKIYRKVVKEFLRDQYWNIYGKFLKNPEYVDNPKLLHFVCKGNICRSPFAHHLLAMIISEGGSSKIKISSSGLTAKQAEKSPENAVMAASNFDVMLREHQPKKLNHAMVKNADMIFGMEAKHVRAMRNNYPEYKQKFFLLALLDNEGSRLKGYQKYNIEDPYGKHIDVFEKCFRRIEKCVTEIAKRCPKK